MDTWKTRKLEELNQMKQNHLVSFEFIQDIVCIIDNTRCPLAQMSVCKNTIISPSFRYLSAIVCLVGLVLLLSHPAVMAQTDFIPQSESQSALTAHEHPWGHFPPSSWARWQVITWTESGGKRIRNVTELKVTLESVDPDGVTLKEVSVVEMGGKRIEIAPVTKRFDFFQEPIQEGTMVASEGTTKLIVDNLIVPCRKQVYERTEPSGKRKTTVWYSKQIYPYVLRVEHVHRGEPTDAAPGGAILSESSSEVLETAAFLVRRSKLGTYRMRTVRKSGSITTVCENFCSRHLPGALRSGTLRELDGTGREIRSVETRLVNWFVPSSIP